MKILVADAIAEEGLGLLKESGFTAVVETGLSEAALCQHVSDCEAVIVRSATFITKRVIRAGQALRVIGRAGVGVDNIDVAAATERGIVVLNTPDANATTTAELTLAHLLSLSRHLPAADRSVRAGRWERSRFLGTEVAGKVLGIVGYGTIGRIVAARCLGLTMRILAHDPFVTESTLITDGVEAASLDRVLAEADFLTLHCPLTGKTRGLINAECIARMKPGARLINCARGELVDEQALLIALERGHLAGAALDVFVQEPPTGSALLHSERLVFTPHLGASTQEAQVAVGVAVARRVASYLSRGEAVNAVNLPHVPTEEMQAMRPYQDLARRLGRVLAALAPAPLDTVEVLLSGRAGEFDPHPIAIEALVGLLQDQMSVPVNRVNARYLAKRQGIALVESRSEATHDYLALVSVIGHHGEEATALVGTLLADSHPRLVRIDDYEVETVPEGTLLITEHEDRPGVVGALGTLLGREQINISRMQVGVAASRRKAIAVIGISAPLSEALLRQVEAIAAVDKVYQLTL